MLSILSPREASSKALIYFNKPLPSIFADKSPSCFYHFYILSAWERTGFVLGSGWGLCTPAAAGELLPSDAAALVLTPAWADATSTEGEEFDRLNKQWINVGYSCAVRGLSQLLPGDGCWAAVDAGVADCASLQLPQDFLGGLPDVQSPCSLSNIIRPGIYLALFNMFSAGLIMCRSLRSPVIIWSFLRAAGIWRGGLK